MNICTADASSNRHRSLATRSRRTLGLTVAILSVLATAEAGFADYTAAKASLSVYAAADTECTTPICSEAQITVTLTADCTSQPCTVTPTEENSQDCAEFPGFSSLMLYDEPTGTCTATDAGRSLLNGPFTLTLAEWQNIFVFDHLIVGKAAGGATASGSLQKADSGIPTLPEWGVVIMAGFLLTAGTVVFRRSRPRPA